MTLTATQSDIFKGIAGNGTTNLKSGRFLQVMKHKGSPEGIRCMGEIIRMLLAHKEETVFA
ncbi:hypothetical protein J9O71_004537 [Salmonella enterica]|nr:hypothetical protein [Salmonella enterica subsp. enterica serovar Thompson]EHI5881750.1 hypothetical protein [Salmonella enterica]